MYFTHLVKLVVEKLKIITTDKDVEIISNLMESIGMYFIRDLNRPLVLSDIFELDHNYNLYQFLGKKPLFVEIRNALVDVGFLSKVGDDDRLYELTSEALNAIFAHCHKTNREVFVKNFAVKDVRLTKEYQRFNAIYDAVNSNVLIVSNSKEIFFNAALLLLSIFEKEPGIQNKHSLVSKFSTAFNDFVYSYKGTPLETMQYVSFSVKDIISLFVKINVVEEIEATETTGPYPVRLVPLITTVKGEIMSTISEQKIKEVLNRVPDPIVDGTLRHLIVHVKCDVFNIINKETKGPLTLEEIISRLSAMTTRMIQQIGHVFNVFVDEQKPKQVVKVIVDEMVKSQIVFEYEQLGPDDKVGYFVRTTADEKKSVYYSFPELGSVAIKTPEGISPALENLQEGKKLVIEPIYIGAKHLGMEAIAVKRLTKEIEAIKNPCDSIGYYFLQEPERNYAIAVLTKLVSMIDVHSFEFEMKDQVMSGSAPHITLRIKRILVPMNAEIANLALDLFK